MITSQDAIAPLASRIEEAYRRRYSGWSSVGATPGVWAAAACRLVEATVAHPSIPIDPEFYVAVQRGSALRNDPWSELTQQRSAKRYLRAVRRVVIALRSEIRSEVRGGLARLGRGEAPERIVPSEGDAISPLACFIVAHRSGRPDLAARFRHEVMLQDRACPLYRIASQGLLAAHLYPTGSVEPTRPFDGPRIVDFSLN